MPGGRASFLGGLGRRPTREVNPMRIVVVSDTHRDFYDLRRLVEKHRTDAQLFLHLGDGLDDLAQVEKLYPQCSFLGVRGNCDFGSSQPLAGCHTVQGARIFYTHGHLYSVKTELGGLLQAARELDANVVLFGHTHQPLCTYREGLHLLNPGSLGYPGEQGRTYGIVDITPQGIACFLATL